MPDLSRRGFLIGAGAAVAAAALPSIPLPAETLTAAKISEIAALGKRVSDIFIVVHPSIWRDLKAEISAMYGPFLPFEGRFITIGSYTYVEQQEIPCPPSRPSNPPTSKRLATIPQRKRSPFNSTQAQRTAMKAYQRNIMRA